MVGISGNAVKQREAKALRKLRRIVVNDNGNVLVQGEDIPEINRELEKISEEEKAMNELKKFIAYIPNLEYFNGMSINAFARFAYIQPCLITIADILVYVTVLMCIIRGVPVLIESRRFINNDKKQV